MFHFAYPYALFLLLLLPAGYYLARLRRDKQRSVAFSSATLFEGAGLEAPWWKREAKWILRALALVLVVIAVARPQTGRSEYTVESEGVDIMLVLDISGSMQAQDFKPKNRLNVAKEVVKEFISKRKHDRIGLVIFAGQAMTQCPLTLDYQILDELVDKVHFGMLEDRTAIGVAVATACNRLKNSKAKSRVIILLTDGQNNAGSVDPLTAAKVAQTLGIKVYTVGVGTNGVVPVPVNDPVFGERVVPMEVRIDETTLKKIAEMTKGKYFLATNAEELKQIYDRIDSLEKTRIKSKTFISYSDRYRYFAVPALVLLMMEVVLSAGVLRETP
jgi:Ca-activated chloride channel family protein